MLTIFSQHLRAGHVSNARRLQYHFISVLFTISILTHSTHKQLHSSILTSNCHKYFTVDHFSAQNVFLHVRCIDVRRNVDMH